MRSPKMAGHPVPGFRVAVVAALAAVIAVFGLSPTPVAAKIRKSRKAPTKADTLHKSSRAHKSHRLAQRGRKLKHQRGAPHHARTHVARRAPDPDEVIIAQGDGSPVLQSAAEFLGRPYRFGSEGKAFDCSGFVQTVFAKIGIELPRSAREQFSQGERVGRDELEPGDLVFFHTYRRTASHVGIYVGDDKFVHAATRGGQVQVDSLSDAYYARRYLGARRLEI
jgi:cell wall-associated NlpC family hydrolase